MRLCGHSVSDLDLKLALVALETSVAVASGVVVAVEPVAHSGSVGKFQTRETVEQSAVVADYCQSLLGVEAVVAAREWEAVGQKTVVVEGAAAAADSKRFRIRLAEPVGHSGSVGNFQNRETAEQSSVDAEHLQSLLAAARELVAAVGLETAVVAVEGGAAAVPKNFQTRLAEPVVSQQCVGSFQH